MRFGPHLLDEILRRTDIVQLVGRRVKLTRKGQAYWGCCPFHNEKSPSFKVENARRTYKCFGCGKGGDAFKWLVETEGLSFPESVERLAGEAGVELPKWTPEEEAREEKKKSLYDVIEATCVFFEEQLRAPAGAEARDYLKSRGLNGEVAKKFRLGYAPSGHATLLEHLKTKNITVDDMVAAGVVRPASEDRGVRDFFYDRLMFPISDPRGRIVAFGGRGLSPDAKPKYINTGETSLFSKGQLLYNFAAARSAAIKAQSIVVAEGYMDVIALVRAGFDYAVAPLGTALTEEQLHILWRTAPEPVMAFDGDTAGLNAAHRAARLALPHLKAGHSLRFAFLPTGEDPDSFIAKQGAAAMRTVLNNSLPLVDVLWRSETEGKEISSEFPERLAGLEAELQRIADQISDSKISKHYKDVFRERVFETYKQRAKASNFVPRFDPRKSSPQRKGMKGVSSALKQSALVASIAPQLPKRRQPVNAADRGQVKFVRPAPPLEPAVRGAQQSAVLMTNPGARLAKEADICVLLLAEPELGIRHAELLADLPFSDASLDRLRHLLLNLAASGSSLEKQGFQNHLSRLGMDDLVARLHARTTGWAGDPAEIDGADARFLKAASDLREMAERVPERARAMERFKTEGTEESWIEVERLMTRHGD